MARNYSTYSRTPYIQGLLESLSNKSTGSNEYRQVMYHLGQVFGEIILEKIKDRHEPISLATTVEDADFLGRGIIDVLEAHDKQVWLTVFWNKRSKPYPDNNISIAPIIKEFHQKGYKKTQLLIIVKSIISNSCVVRTNLTRFIEEVVPTSIFVVAPVLYKGAIDNLNNEFGPDVSKQFQYLYLAEDDQRTKNGIVEPGIGGDVYQRLGWDGQDGKNKYTPEIVKLRR